MSEDCVELREQYKALQKKYGEEASDFRNRESQIAALYNVIDELKRDVKQAENRRDALIEAEVQGNEKLQIALREKAVLEQNYTNAMDELSQLRDYNKELETAIKDVIAIMGERSKKFQELIQ